MPKRRTAREAAEEYQTLISNNSSLIEEIRKRNQGVEDKHDRFQGFVDIMKLSGYCDSRLDEISNRVKLFQKQKKELTGPKNKKKRNAINKKIQKMIDAFLASDTVNNPSELDKDSVLYRMVHSEMAAKDDRKTIKSVRFCSNPKCKIKMLDWKGCKCKLAWYCGKKCQIEDWKDHKKKCTVKK